MRWPCCSACARTRSTCRSAAWSTPRCSTRAAASRATSRSRASPTNAFFILTGSAQAHARLRVDRAAHRRGRARGAGRRHERVLRALGDGPAGARAAVAAVGADDLSKDALPFSTTREIDVGCARVRAARMSYVGGPGYELYVPTDQCVTLYDALRERRRRIRAARRRLLHDRRAAHRSGPPRLGRRAVARRNAARSRSAATR